MLKKIILLGAFFLSLNFLKAQTPNEYLLFSHESYLKLNKTVYDKNNNFHSSLRPYFADDSLLRPLADSLLNYQKDSVKKSWIKRKLLHEHLIDIQKSDYSFYADFLPDFVAGYDKQTDDVIWLNTRGFQVGGKIGKKFSFYTSGYENQAKFPQYLLNYVNENGIIPGQVNDKFGSQKEIKDWAYSTALLSYTPVKYINITLGQGKNFIGDGYRSMILSDVSANYPFLKLTGNLGNVKYMAMWAQFQDLKAPQFSYDNGYRKKWGVFHYLDWNVNKRLSLGFFDAVIWQDADESGKRGFDFSYINPVIFLRPLEGQNGSPDNALIGFNAKYELLDKLSVYGQFVADEFTAKEVFAGNGYWANKFAYQIGAKGFDFMGVKNWNYLIEFNTARPYTYSQRTSLLNYGNYNQSLAHPFGANFREMVALSTFSVKRWNLYGKINWATYGLNKDGLNYGKDIFESYNTRVGNYDNKTAQGLKTNFLFLDGRISYLINPKYNLRLELGGIIRIEDNDAFNSKTGMISFGLRSSFRNFYQDF